MFQAPVVLIILDGFGYSPTFEGNAISQARTPNLDRLWNIVEKKGLLLASESAVGLDDGYAGNSEVGHLNIGAGQIVVQSLHQINESITRGEFEKNNVIIENFKSAKNKGKKVHLMGVLSTAGVHSHISHLFKLLDICKDLGINPYIHAFLDGRDTGETEAYFYLDKLNQKFKTDKIGRIASISGRYYAMDRNTSWDRTQKAYDAITGVNGKYAKDVFMALQESYKNNEKDEIFVPTIMVDDDNNPIGKVEDGDCVLFFNFREDRARQIAQAFVDPEFVGFKREVTFEELNFVSLVGYSEGLRTKVVFPSIKIECTISDIISTEGITQIHIAETEKYAHVTYFFNGGVEEKHSLEDFFMIKSPSVKDYVTTPAMSAYQIKEEVISQLSRNYYQFYLINFANPDMIGHTGDLESAKKAVEVVDECVGEIVWKVLSQKGRLLITSDHGNCEVMINPITKEIDKSHTLNPVPYMIVDNPEYLPTFTKLFLNQDINSSLPVFQYPGSKVGSGVNKAPVGVLSDVGTTILYMLGLKPASCMTGVDLNNL